MPSRQAHRIVIQIALHGCFAYFMLSLFMLLNLKICAKVFPSAFCLTKYCYLIELLMSIYEQS